MSSPKSDARMGEIVDAAARIFEARGYFNATMDDVAEAVGIRKPTLYHYVESKGQIVALIHDRVGDRFIDRINSQIASGASSADCLESVMINIFEMLGDNPGHLRVYFENHREIPKKYQRVSRGKRDEYFRTIRDLIARGVDDGEFFVADVEMATLALFGMCNWAYQWYRPGGQYSPQEIGQMFWRIFHLGIQIRVTT